MSKNNKKFYYHQHSQIKTPRSIFEGVANYQLSGGYPSYQRVLIYKLAKDNESLIQRMTRYQTCKVHTGCVNSICWNDRGTTILSGSDDQRLKITDPFGRVPKILLDYKTTHRSNIFCARFLPQSSDTRVVSCSGDGMILYTDINRSAEENSTCRFNCHDGTCYKIVTVQNEPHTFISCGEDHTVRFYDLRVKENCGCLNQRNGTDVIVSAPRAVTSMAINPLVPWYMAVGTADSSVRIYDRRTLSIGGKGDCYDAQGKSELRHLTVPELESSERFYRITSLTYSPCGTQILASYSSDYLYLFDTQSPSSNDHKRLKLSEKPEDEIVEEVSAEDSTTTTPPLASTSRPSPPVSTIEPTAGPSQETQPVTTTSTTTTPTASTLDKKKKQTKPQLRRLRLRGDWSDTGPNARPQHQSGGEIAQARPTLQQSLMERMTFVLSQMLNDVSNVSNSGEQPSSSRTNGHVNVPDVDDDDEDDGGLMMGGGGSVGSGGARGSFDDIGRVASGGSGGEQHHEQRERSTSVGTSSDHLEDQLASLRNSFVSRHNVEPGAVSLSYREGGSNAGLISVSVGSESERGASSNSSSSSSSNSSSSGAGAAEPSSSSMMPSSSSDLNEPGPSSLLHTAAETRKHDQVKMVKRSPGGKVLMKYTGHRNARTMIKEANFYGEDYVASGSDCGHVIIWERSTGRIVQILEADNHVVNNVQPHPIDPIIATSGIDYDIKLFAPLSDEPTFDFGVAKELMKRNEVMLEETKDTITVPAAFMIRMLSCLSHIRRLGQNNNNNNNNNSNQASIPQVHVATRRRNDNNNDDDNNPPPRSEQQQRDSESGGGGGSGEQ